MPLPHLTLVPWQLLPPCSWVMGWWLGPFHHTFWSSCHPEVTHISCLGLGPKHVSPNVIAYDGCLEDSKDRLMESGFTRCQHQVACRDTWALGSYRSTADRWDRLHWPPQHKAGPNCKGAQLCLFQGQRQVRPGQNPKPGVGGGEFLSWHKWFRRAFDTSRGQERTASMTEDSYILDIPRESRALSPKGLNVEPMCRGSMLTVSIILPIVFPI